MKKKNRQQVLIAFLLLPAVAAFTGCELLRETHDQARASLDRSKFNEKGESFDNDDIRPLGTMGTNFRYLKFFSFPYTYTKSKIDSRFMDNQYGPQILNFQDDFENSYFKEPEKKDFFTLCTGLEFVGKGNKEKFEGSGFTTRIYYLKLPILFNYNYKTGSNGNYLHGGLGPYAAAALFGHEKWDGGKTTLHFGSGDDKDFKRMDYGLEFNAGYVFMKKWDLSIGYDLGLRNLLNDNIDKQRNRTISINIGYFFR